MKDKMAKIIKGVGFVYIFLNCVVFLVMFIFAIHAKMKTNMGPGFLVFILPVMGIFSGYWMRISKYGWWRLVIIISSIAKCKETRCCCRSTKTCRNTASVVGK